MKDTVCVLVYSYQGKGLDEFIDSLIDNFNYEQNLYIYLIDHNNVNRSEKFNIRKNGVVVSYKFVNWDIVKSPIDLKQDYISGSNGKWFAQIGDGVDLVKDWNKIFIEFLDSRNNAVLSGNHKIKLESRDPFFISTQKLDSDFYEKNNWFDRDFIFCRMDDIKKIGYPSGFKFRGEEELMSLDAKIKGYEIFSVPTKYINNKTISLSDRQYVSFSLTHNYNNFIRFLEENNDKISIYKDYCFNFDKLNKLPFENNDIYYDQKKGKFDDVDGIRYIERIRKID